MKYTYQVIFFMHIHTYAGYKYATQEASRTYTNTGCVLRLRAKARTQQEKAQVSFYIFALLRFCVTKRRQKSKILFKIPFKPI